MKLHPDLPIRGGSYAIRLTAPRVFNVSARESRGPTVRFLRDLCLHAARGRTIRIDLSRVEMLFPCGTLLFVAELYRLLDMTATPARVSCNYPKRPVVEELFQHIGLLSRLGLSPRRQIGHERVKYWSLHRGTDVDLTGIEELNARLLPELGDELTFGLLGGIKEAVTNSVHHAYLFDRDDVVACKGHGWWLFAQQKGENIDISICDLGVGIDRSLPRSGTWSRELLETVMRLIPGRFVHVRPIVAALELGRTRTGESNRGKGLHEMLQVVKDAGAGFLRILSNRGIYSYDARKGTELLLDAEESIWGTIVQWTFTASDFAQRSRDEKDD